MTVAEKTNVIPAGTYELDAAHSSASFAIRHAASPFRGGFKVLDATLVAPREGEPSLSGSVRVESIDIEDENIRPHLLSPEFFDVERTPEMSFSSSSISGDGDELVVRGTLEIAGRGHEVEARGHVSGPFAVPGGSEKLGLELRAEIDRTDYGFDWNMETPGGETILGNEVEIEVSLELSRKDA